MQRHEALFTRAFADPKFGIDADAVREYLAASLTSRNPTDKLFVASSRGHGLCGLSIVTLGVSPLSPIPWVPHFYTDTRGAKKPLLDATLDTIEGAGFTRLACHNGTGASDKVHMRAFGDRLQGAVKGSMIIYDLRK